MVQKKRHLIHGKTMVEVIYRKSSKPSRRLNETADSEDESNSGLDSVDKDNNPFNKREKKVGMELAT